MKGFLELSPAEQVSILIYRCHPSEAGKKKVFFTASDVGQPTMVLTTGCMTPYFINIRDLTCANFKEGSPFEIIVGLLVDNIRSKLEGQEYDAIITAAEAGCPWGGATAWNLGKSAPYMTSKVKKGLGQEGMTIESPVTGEVLQLLHVYGQVAGKKAVFLEDTVSSFKTGEVVYFSARRAGLEVLQDTFCVFDRLQYPLELKERLGLEIHSLVDVLEFTDIGLKLGDLNRGDYDLIRLYQQDEQAYCLKVIEDNPEFFKGNEMTPKIIEYYANNGMPAVADALKSF